MTRISSTKLNILVAEDDPDDRLLIKEAIGETGFTNRIEFVNDGVELMDHLRRSVMEPTVDGLPTLVLLDLNMPRKDGRAAMAEIKADPDLRRTPVVILTTSKADEDIRGTYDMGGNSYIVKPATFERLVDSMKTLIAYWQDLVSLPVKADLARQR